MPPNDQYDLCLMICKSDFNSALKTFTANHITLRNLCCVVEMVESNGKDKGIIQNEFFLLVNFIVSNGSPYHFCQIIIIMCEE